MAEKWLENPLDLRVETSLLSERIIPGLKDRKEDCYMLKTHLSYIEEGKIDIESGFVKNVTHPLFEDFSKGKPSYNKANTGEEWVSRDFEIIEDVYNFIESKKLQTDSDIFRRGFIEKENKELKEKRLSLYLEDVCRRAKYEEYHEMNGLQITTPYDYGDIKQVLGPDKLSQIIGESETEAVLTYGPEKIRFADVREAYDSYLELKERFNDRNPENKISAPNLTVFG